MISNIYSKIRSLIGDLGETNKEAFEFTGSNDCPLMESNNVIISTVLKNDLVLPSGESYTFDDVSIVTYVGTLVTNDIVTISYSYRKYSNDELKEYIRAALVFISVNTNCSTDYELEDTDIVPTLSNKTLDLICMIASILINPNFLEKRTADSTVKYLRTMSKTQKIEKLISMFYRGATGITGTIEWN